METREKLCRAALDAMNEVGYGRFATEDVAERAKVSRGALTHQFSSRNQLIIAAYDYLMTSWEHGWGQIARYPKRLEPVEVTDLLWNNLYRSPHYVASLEIMLAARNDDELGKGIRAIMVRWSAHRDRLIAQLLGTSASDKKTRQFVQMNLCVLRGIALNPNFSSETSSNVQGKLVEEWKRIVTSDFHFTTKP
ncbi:TetR family transcriptional regulator [Bradyrhizobium iriomotense]|uniref:TetR family transcriptional regulator n=1 Tax=Bradyrhizobium iriomotense TaxID=441950 RepID=A0ABQ6BA26_9BRAD|nr:TetR family transcriptional regulator [Bradyrhizobium iriomotense]